MLLSRPVHGAITHSVTFPTLEGFAVKVQPAKKLENNGEAILRESGSEKGGKERTEAAGGVRGKKNKRKDMARA